MTQKPTYAELKKQVKVLKKTESALRESEELYRDLFENAPIGIGIADPNGNLIDFNAAILRPGEYASEDMSGIKNIKKLYYDPKDRSDVLSRLKKRGFVDSAGVQFRSKDGQPYDCLLSLRPITYKKKLCTQAIVQDVTRLKEVEKLLMGQPPEVPCPCGNHQRLDLGSRSEPALTLSAIKKSRTYLGL